MKTVALQSTSDSAPLKTQHMPSTPVPVPASFIQPHSAIDGDVVQRKASCACGGGCPSCQAKSSDLRVSQLDDPFEIEADRIADKIFRVPVADGIQTRQNTAILAPMIQTKNYGGHSGGAPVRGEIVSRINSARGGGNGLDSETRGFMESRFGADLGSVRVHTGTEAVRLNRELNARAFTLGSDIYFNEDQYQPRTESGRRLLAHELTHTVQQKNIENSIKQIQRTPGVDARDSWDSMVNLTISSAQAAVMRGMAQEAITRMLTISDGAALINNLWRLACSRVRSGNCRGKIQVSFLDKPAFQVSCATKEALGCLQPSTKDSFPYEVFVENRDSRDETGLSGFYGTGPYQVYMPHVDAQSDMASTLFHELLHIEFVNDGIQRQYPTGHGDAMKGEIDPEFSRRLKSFENRLGELETQIHERAKAQTESAPPPRQMPDLDRETTPARAEPSRPLIGGRLSLGGGYAGGGAIGRSFTGVVGADLILERIAGLGIGGRGVYLSPDRLLAGPALSGRALGEGDKPLFFDIEAGVLFEISSSTSSRIANTLTGYASAGLGREFGRSGGRFFWRLGGFVIISDRLDTHTGAGFGGGVTAGAGVNF